MTGTTRTRGGVRTAAAVAAVAVVVLGGCSVEVTTGEEAEQQMEEMTDGDAA